MANWLDNVIQAALKHKVACEKFGEDLKKIDFGTIGPKPLSGPPPKPMRNKTLDDIYTDYLSETINNLINYTESLELKIEMLEKRITELEKIK